MEGEGVGGQTSSDFQTTPVAYPSSYHSTSRTPKASSRLPPRLLEPHSPEKENESDNQPQPSSQPKEAIKRY